jgi:hypothetical protein
MTSVVRSFFPAACAVVGLLAIAGCNRDRDRLDRRDDRSPVVVNERDKDPGTTTITGANMAGSVSNQNAVDRIVSARCAREQTCNNVGVDKRYANPPACSAKLKSDMREDLNAKDCPYGVDQKELNECLESIRKEDCNNPLDAISRIGACRTGDMCLKTGAPNH